MMFSKEEESSLLPLICDNSFDEFTWERWVIIEMDEETEDEDEEEEIEFGNGGSPRFDEAMVAGRQAETPSRWAPVVKTVL